MSVSSHSFSQHQTLGTSGCGLSQNNCHTNENNWWKDDAHKVTVDAFYDDPASYEKIAKLAGVDPANMLKGNNQCMTCHGTIVSGKEAREVEEGVSCESCHGAGSGYKDPHSEGQAGQGINRTGYKKGLQLGMVENKNIDVRGKTCVKCHYITDQKLISAGHPDGARFNYISGIKKIAKHWKRPPADADLNKAPFEKAMSAKGPVAQIEKVEAAATPGQSPSQAATPQAAQPVANPPATAQPVTDQPATNRPEEEKPPATSPSVIGSNSTAPATPAASPATTVVKSPVTPAGDRGATASLNDPPLQGDARPGNRMPATMPAAPAPMPTAIDLTMPPAQSPLGVDTMRVPGLPPAMGFGPFPQISDSTSIREVLIILKKRLEMLHQRSSKTNLPQN
ncbi:MAG: multiheme c-type cytochrome [bacterium]